jgi:hypothetical protein
MRHRWARSWWQTVRHLAWCERCEKCGAVRKMGKRSWRYAWPDGWHGLRPDCETVDAPKDGAQRELFEGEVKA